MQDATLLHFSNTIYPYSLHFSNKDKGRGGKVIHVTNLNDAGAGSVRETLARSGPRIVVFDVSYICSIWIIPPPP